MKKKSDNESKKAKALAKKLAKRMATLANIEDRIKTDTRTKLE